MAKTGISLVVVSTDTYELGLQAVVKSVKNFNFDEVLILSDLQEAWGDFPIKKIDRFKSGRDYNIFILSELHKYINTDFFIVVQYDGFVLRGDQFSPHFYHYDYIGAPWPFHDSLNVGNGGFSWRSRRLAEAAAKIFETHPPEPDEPVLEDHYLCRLNRVLLEEKFAMRFASEGIAEHFSVEHGTRPFPTFGFHGVWHLPKIYSDRLDWLMEKLPPRLLENDAMYSFLADEMYNVSVPHYRKLTKLKGQANRKGYGLLGVRRWLGAR
jgi:hypothetical protein